MKTCATCEHFESGLCYLNPPVWIEAINYAGQQESSGTLISIRELRCIRPVTLDNDKACGEWKQQEAQPHD